MIHRADGLPPHIHDIADDHQFVPMGDAVEVRSNISKVLPDVDWSDPAWGVLDGDGYSIEFNFQPDGPVTGFMLHVRGGSDPIAAIVKLCSAHGWAAIDTSTGDYIDLQAPSHEGWESFQGFRDQIVGRLEADESSWLQRLWRRLFP